MVDSIGMANTWMRVSVFGNLREELGWDWRVLTRRPREQESSLYVNKHHHPTLLPSYLPLITAYPLILYLPK